VGFRWRWERVVVGRSGGWRLAVRFLKKTLLGFLS
jgi:hypothetical protein